MALAKWLNKSLISMALTFLCLAIEAAASETDSLPANRQAMIQIKETQHRSEMSVGTEVVQIQTPTTNLSGFGVTLGYNLTLDPSYAIRTHLSQAFSTSQGGGSLYTGVGASALYALRGSFGWSERELVSNGSSIVQVRGRPGSLWTIGAGFEQLFLSGNEAVYPAPGVILTTAYSMTLWDRRCSFGLKFGQYKNSDRNITGTMLGVSLPIDL